MPRSPRSIRKISDDHKAFALGCQTQARNQAYELPTFRSMLAGRYAASRAPSTDEKPSITGWTNPRLSLSAA